MFDDGLFLIFSAFRVYFYILLCSVVLLIFRIEKSSMIQLKYKFSKVEFYTLDISSKNIISILELTPNSTGNDNQKMLNNRNNSR